MRRHGNCEMAKENEIFFLSPLLNQLSGLSYFFNSALTVLTSLNYALIDPEDSISNSISDYIKFIPKSNRKDK